MSTQSKPLTGSCALFGGQLGSYRVALTMPEGPLTVNMCRFEPLLQQQTAVNLGFPGFPHPARSLRMVNGPPGQPR